MSWSLQLRHGDLALSGASFGTVTNGQKLVQDLRCWILERMGNDSMHPAYGSLIDGGIRPDGTIELGMIGETDPEYALMVIEGELHRIVSEYQAQQLARAKGDRFTYNKATLTAREVLLSLIGIEATMLGDSLTLTLSIQTGNGNFDLSIDFPTDGTFTI